MSDLTCCKCGSAVPDAAITWRNLGRHFKISATCSGCGCREDEVQVGKIETVEQAKEVFNKCKV